MFLMATLAIFINVSMANNENERNLNDLSESFKKIQAEAEEKDNNCTLQVEDLMKEHQYIAHRLETCEKNLTNLIETLNNQQENQLETFETETTSGPKVAGGYQETMDSVNKQVEICKEEKENLAIRLETCESKTNETEFDNPENQTLVDEAKIENSQNKESAEDETYFKVSISVASVIAGAIVLLIIGIIVLAAIVFKLKQNQKDVKKEP
jgi:chromosome segregation ATPase